MSVMLSEKNQTKNPIPLHEILGKDKFIYRKIDKCFSKIRV